MSDEEVITGSEDELQDEAPAPKKGGRPKKLKNTPNLSGKPRGRPKGPPKPKKTPMKRGRKPGSGIQKAKPTHAPFTKLVTEAIQILQLENKKGASKIAIVKHIMDEEPECSEKAAVVKSVRTALHRLLAQEAIVAPHGLMGKIKLVNSDSKTTVKKSASKGPGRPKKSEGVRTKKAKSTYVPSGKPRGRPKKDAATPKKAASTPKKAKSAASTPKKAKSAYVPSGKPRGRPKQEGSTPKPAYVPSGKPRGRPKKSD